MTSWNALANSLMRHLKLVDTVKGGKKVFSGRGTLEKASLFKIIKLINNTI